MASEGISEFTPSRCPIASPNSLGHGLQMHLWVHSISASKCISKLAQSRPWSVSLSSLNLGLQHQQKCIFVTGRLWECLRVVGPESRGGQIPEITGQMQWPSGTPGSTWEHRRQAWERRWLAWKHLGALATSLKAPINILGARRITVEQCGKNIIFFENAAGVPRNYSYYLWFNDF